ncbi:XRE family transcriptional regulator [Ruegeria sp. 2012CJ41-6]|uniref:XRE family transcriptional regulator n=1 Tax=Ruegeria spongiae TaxID=2942209 RepID=A0ABT0Q9B6_9RHOB|nr:XRE family transcriptional regulator [Ruegeria spongiae]MCL6286007.1 XRE family transcriptional regulator [Ruegeria spongiae]
MKKPIKAARILADLTQQELCQRADIPLITLRRLEGRPSHKGLVSEETEANVVVALEQAGVDFIPENGGGHGVRLRKKSDAE